MEYYKLSPIERKAEFLRLCEIGRKNEFFKVQLAIYLSLKGEYTPKFEFRFGIDKVNPVKRKSMYLNVESYLRKEGSRVTNPPAEILEMTKNFVEEFCK